MHTLTHKTIYIYIVYMYNKINNHDKMETEVTLCHLALVGGVAGRGVALCRTGILGNPAKGGAFCDCKVGGLGAGRSGGGLGGGTGVDDLGWKGGAGFWMGGVALGAAWPRCRISSGKAGR